MFYTKDGVHKLRQDIRPLGPVRGDAGVRLLIIITSGHKALGTLGPGGNHAGNMDFPSVTRANR